MPYLKFLYILFLMYNKNTDKIIAELKKCNLPTGCIEAGYESFLLAIQGASSNFLSCIYIDLEEEEFDKYASLLEVNRFCTKGLISPVVYRIACDELIKQHVECCLLTNVSIELIVEDVKKLYNKDLTHDDVISFKTLFFRDLETTDWVAYTNSLVQVERDFKNKCRAKGKDYTRWVLGCNVSLDIKNITSDLITDAYFRYKDKANRPDVDSFEQAVKLGGLLTKFIDRNQKISDKTPDDSASDALQLCMFTGEENKPKSLKEALAENDQQHTV